MPNKPLRDNQELAVLHHPKMERFEGMKTKIKKGQKTVEVSQPFTSYWNALFERTDFKEEVAFKGQKFDAVYFEFKKVVRS